MRYHASKKLKDSARCNSRRKDKAQKKEKQKTKREKEREEKEKNSGNFRRSQSMTKRKWPCFAYFCVRNKYEWNENPREQNKRLNEIQVANWCALPGALWKRRLKLPFDFPRTFFVKVATRFAGFVKEHEHVLRAKRSVSSSVFSPLVTSFQREPDIFCTENLDRPPQSLASNNVRKHFRRFLPLVLLFFPLSPVANLRSSFAASLHEFSGFEEIRVSGFVERNSWVPDVN